MAIGWGAVVGYVAKIVANVSGMFSSRQKQAEREGERSVGAKLGNLDAAEKGMATADSVAKDLAEQYTDEEIDAKAIAVAERRAARRKRK